MNSDGQLLRYDASEGIYRRAYDWDCCPCILPGGKILDGAGVHILSGYHLLRLQGLVNTVDVNLDDAYAEATERESADMAGNACCGWCFGEFLMVTWSVSVSTPR